MAPSPHNPLAALKAATSHLSQFDRECFEQRLIGGLSSICPPELWNKALATVAASYSVLSAGYVPPAACDIHRNCSEADRVAKVTGHPVGAYHCEGETEWTGPKPAWLPWKLSPDSDPGQRWILVSAENDEIEHPAGKLYDTEREAWEVARNTGAEPGEGGKS